MLLGKTGSRWSISIAAISPCGRMLALPDFLGVIHHRAHEKQRRAGNEQTEHNARKTVNERRCDESGERYIEQDFGADGNQIDDARIRGADFGAALYAYFLASREQAIAIDASFHTGSYRIQ